MKGRLIPDAKTIGFNNNNNFHKLNEIGLNKAYNNNKIHVDGDTLFIAGTSNLKDAYDDITKIPFYGSTMDSTRYDQAKTVLDSNPHIKNLVGHSLGGSVSLEIQKKMLNTKQLLMVRQFYKSAQNKEIGIVSRLTQLVT